MNKLISALCATLISAGTLAPVETAGAGPLTIQQPIETARAAAPNPDLQNVRRDRWERRWDRRHNRWERRHYRRHNRWERRHYRRWDRPYYRRWDRPYGDRRYYRRWGGPRYYRTWDGPYYNNRYYRRNGVSVILDF